jgi:hypothetical protein
MEALLTFFPLEVVSSFAFIWRRSADGGGTSQEVERCITPPANRSEIFAYEAGRTAEMEPFDGQPPAGCVGTWSVTFR